MGLFNEHSSTTKTDSSSTQGPSGPQGIGYKLDANGNFDIENKKLTNVQNGDMDRDVMTKSQIEGYVSNKTQYLDGVLPAKVTNNKAVIYSPSGGIHSNGLYLRDQNGQESHFINELQDLNQCRLYIPNLKDNDSYGGRLKSSIMVTSINQTIEGKKIFHDIEVPNPQISSHASNKAYTDNEIAKISDALDNSNYVKKSGDTMSGNLNMDNHMITNVKTPINDNDVANKGYIDNHLIQSAHPQTNILKYIMDDVDQTSSEYGIEIDKIDNYDESFHSYNKKVIYLKLLKDVNNCRARIGYNIYQLIDKNKNKYYTAVIEWLTTDNNAWTKMEIFNNITSGSIISNQTRKFEDGKGLYYTRSIVQFEVMSISSAPLYLLSTIHIDGVNPTYPAKFSEMYNIIYGIDGNHSAILSEVYDTHKAYEIEKTKMKMLVPLDLNNKKIINISNDSDVTKINLYGMVDKRRFFTAFTMPIEFNKVRIVNIKLLNTAKTRLKKDIINFYITSSSIIKYPFTFPGYPAYIYIQINKFFDVINYIKLVNTVDIPFQITYDVFY